MPGAMVNGIHIHYEVHGSGEPLLLIMGLGANATALEMQIPAFSREFQVIAFDNRGAGRSDKPSGAYSISLLADDAAALLDELGIGGAHVFGMSMGGMIAQELVLRHPERVKTLVLGATMCGGPNAIMAGPQMIQQWISAAGLPLEQAIEVGLTFLYSEEFLADNKQWLMKRSFELSSLMPPPHALQSQVIAVLGFNAYDRLQRVQVPTLILTGTKDKIIPAANSRILAERIASARLEEFPGSGHGFLVENAEEINQAVLGFLRPFKSQSFGPK